MRPKPRDPCVALPPSRPCKRRRLAAWTACAATALWAGPSLAQHSPALDRFDIGVGTYHANSNTTLGVALPHGLFAGSASLEDDLGFGDSESLPRFRAHYLIGDHQGLSVDYYRYSRASGNSWQHTLGWRDYRYDLDARLYGRVSFAFGSLAWRWWFGNDDDVFGLGFGASHYRASGRIEGRVRVNGETVANLDESTGASAWAPLLQLGWRHAFNPHWRMYLDAAGVFKGGGDLSGDIYNASIGVKWLPVEHLGFALEYDVNSIHIEQEHEYYTDSLDVQLHGPSAFVYLRF